MNAEIKGWCPGALRPMAAHDGLVVRVRTPMSRLSSQQAKTIADLSTQYGNGLLDLSARGNLQMRGVSEDNHPLLIDALRELGLIDASIDIEARRNIVLPPFWQEGDTTEQIARELIKELSKQDGPAISGKFGFAIDCGPVPLIRTISADIRIEQSEAGLICRADGSDQGRLVTKENAAKAAIELAHWFIATGGVVKNRGRMAAHIKDHALPAHYLESPAQEASAPTPKPGQTKEGFLVGATFGQITAETFASLAELAPIRITPWRMLMLEGCKTEPVLNEEAGLITKGDDPRLQLVACTGAPACLQAHGDTRKLALSLCHDLPQGSILHISGCSKGCAQPKQPADFTLIARDKNRYALIRNGTVFDAPATENLTIDELTTTPQTHLVRA